MNDIFLINDSRKISCFSKNSFSKYKKTDIIKLFEKNLILSKHYDASFIGIELHISLYINDLFQNLFYISSLYTNIDYPNLPNLLNGYLLKYYTILGEIKKEKNILYKDHRNNQEIRNLISKMICLVSLSPKNNNFQLGLLHKIDQIDYDILIIKKKIKADNLELTKNMFYDNELEELILVLNEIAYLLRFSNNDIKTIIYWISWIHELENKSKNLNLNFRKIKDVNQKLTNLWEWILWNIILNEVYYRNNDKLYLQIYGLYNFYKFNFKKSNIKKYLVYIFHAVYLLKNNIDFQKNPLKDKNHLIIETTLSNNIFYKTIFSKSEDKYFIEMKDDTVEKENKIVKEKHLKEKHPKEKKLSKKEEEIQKMNNRMNYLYNIIC